jgi:replicative DNA helicase
LTLDKAEQILFAITQRINNQDFTSLRDILETYFDRMELVHEHKGTIVGVPSGFHDLDELTGGLQKSDLVIVAARPATGKTSFALSDAHNAARAGKTVGVFSLEMSSEQIVQRLLSIESGVDMQRLRLGYLNDAEWQRLSDAFGRLAEAPIYIDDSAALSVMELRSRARRLQAEVGVDLLMVDYLQLMQGRRAGGSDNRVQEVSEITRGLKQLARELDAPVIALSQLSRAVESRQSHVPMLSDLRESGSIEQDADIVMFIYREELYNPETERKGIAEIHVAKHRNGPTGVVPLRFFPETTRFADLEVYRQPAP